MVCCAVVALCCALLLVLLLLSCRGVMVVVVLIFGEQGWRSGESARLPPMWPGFDSGPVPYVG